MTLVEERQCVPVGVDGAAGGLDLAPPVGGLTYRDNAVLKHSNTVVLDTWCRKAVPVPASGPSRSRSIQIASLLLSAAACPVPATLSRCLLLNTVCKCHMTEHISNHSNKRHAEEIIARNEQIIKNF